jgi:hypothetical protein
VKQVLTLDGGGIRGVLPASFLAIVEGEIDGDIVDYFDLVVGTSTGGMIALGLGAGLSATEIRDFYLDRGARIFRGMPLLRRVRRWATAKYDHEQLHTELREVFGDRKLGDSKTRLVIPSMDVNSGRVHLWKTAHHKRFVQDYAASMVEVAMATSAAPTYFQAFMTEAGTPLVDGGVFANNPAGLAAVEAIGVLNWPRDQIRILSLGCGDEALDIRTGGWRRSGIAGWAPKLAAVLMAAQSDASLGAATHLLADRNNLVRISPSLPSGRYGLDVVHELTSLRAWGEAEARRQIQNLRPFFQQRAAPFTPFRTTEAGPG